MSAAENAPKRKMNTALAIAIAVAVGGVVALLLVHHGPWNRPVVASPAVVRNTDTAAAAKAAGAIITPTDPKPAIEPTATGPKPAQPAVPDGENRK
jgi:hypothetical protein